MNTSLVGYQGKQLTLNFDDLDRPQLSLCPKCSSDIIKLADGCPICGWSEKQSVKPSFSISCTVKQPNQPERQGVIKQDLGSRFLVDIPSENSTVTVPKLFVYPDFSKLDKCSRKTTHPSKTRRQKGEGSGAIFYRTVTKKGTDYQEAYYKWRSDGKQRSKYIPNKLLDKVKQAESRKLPVEDILVLLGCIKKCSRKKFDTLSAEVDEKVLNRSNKCSRKNIHPSKRRREKGRGTAYIECKPITKNGKQYKQYWFHWQVWRDGETVIKKSRYIPKRLVPKIIRMNNEKASVEKILKVLETKSKRRN